MAGGQAIEGAKRGVLFHVNPDDVELQGIDYQSGPEDVCYNPRNNDPIPEALIDSIMRLGVLEPIGVLKASGNGKTGSGKPIVLYGNQRVRAAREANVRLKKAGKPVVQIPCLTPLRGFSEAELSEAALAENEIRRETSALAKSELAGIHLRRCGGDFRMAAQAFGVSDNHFRQLIKLKEAAPAVKKAIEKGKIGTSAAIEIASLPAGEQEQRLEQVVAAGGTVAAAVKVKREANGTSKTTRPGSALLKQLWKKRKSEDVARNLDEGFVDALGWILGEIEASEIAGLENAIDVLEACV